MASRFWNINHSYYRNLILICSKIVVGSEVASCYVYRSLGVDLFLSSFFIKDLRPPPPPITVMTGEQFFKSTAELFLTKIDRDALDSFSCNLIPGYDPSRRFSCAGNNWSNDRGGWLSKRLCHLIGSTMVLCPFTPAYEEFLNFIDSIGALVSFLKGSRVP